MYTNADQLRNKMEELKLYVTNHSPDIICITETKPKRKDFDLTKPEISIENYNLFTNNLSAADNNRGCAIYIRNHISAEQITFEDSNVHDSVWIEVNLLNSDKLLIGCVYRSPNADSVYNDNVNKLLVHISQAGYSHILVVGDFNYKGINWTTWSANVSEKDPANKFLEAVRDSYLIQHIETATRIRGDQEPSLLDLVLTNEEGMIEDLELLSPLGKSDHAVIDFSFRCYSTKSITNTTKYQFNKGNYNEIRNELSEHNWSVTLQEQETIDDMWDKFSNKIKSSIEKHIPKKQYRPGERKNIKHLTPLDQNAIRKIKKKHRAWNRYMETRESHQYRNYCRLRTQVRQLTKKARKNYEKKIADESKDNPKAFWSFANSQTKTKEGISNLKKNGITAENDKDKADMLLKQFSSVFTNETTDSPKFDKRQVTIEDEPLVLTEEEVEKSLQKLNVNKSAGPDGIPPKLYRELSKELAKPLTIIFNKSLDTGTVPKAWKIANITPIFKKGKKSEPSNYRPVSLTSIACKTLESFIRGNILAHMRNNSLLSNRQFGFLNGRSTVLQLLKVLDEWMEILDNSNASIDTIYLDFSKAFDTVPHNRLLAKMRGYQIHNQICDWVQNFLSDRIQQVCVNGTMSESAPVTSGIPQGSVLGPVLFILFINDLPDNIDNEIYLFADDTKIYSTVNSPLEEENLQRDLSKLEEWSNRWLLQFNASKCKVLHLGKNKGSHEYSLNNTNLEASNIEKDLGVNIDNNLSFSDHINIIVNKANRTMGVIRRSFKNLNQHIFLKLYKGLVRPQLEYAGQVWSPYLKKDIKKLESVQRRATKLVNDLNEDDYKVRLKRLKLPTLLYRRMRGDLIETFKILTGINDPAVCDFLPLHAVARPNSRTRGHPYKLFKKPTTHQPNTNYFSNRIVDWWNNLPQEVVLAPSVKSFEGRLDKHWESLTVKYDFDTAISSITSISDLAKLKVDQ